MEKQRTYFAIDLKSFYASVECVERGLDPLKTNLVVADISRTQKTICLAITPPLKAYGLGGRARLFEVEQCVRKENLKRCKLLPSQQLKGKSASSEELEAHPELAIDYIVAKPRMAFYMHYSSLIKSIYEKFFSNDDILVYSVDEVFCDATPYMKMYNTTSKELAKQIIQAIYEETGITATAGIGTNLYLAKVAMDIVAKHIAPDKDNVRIAELNERTFREQLWNHRPLTDFWQIGYSTVQNWYPGDENGKGGVLNLVTKRGDLRGVDSKLSWTQVETGSAITWKYPSCILRGDNSQAEFYSVAVTNNYQEADTGTKMIHIGKNTKSTIISKGISAGHSQNSYRGLVRAASTADNARNYSSCDSLLLGSDCGAHTFPYMDVHNDTAIFEHEATTSKISEDQLFYCNQRGIPTEQAVGLIVNGYAKEVLQKLPMEFAVEAQKLLSVSLEGTVG